MGHKDHGQCSAEWIGGGLEVGLIRMVKPAVLRRNAEILAPLFGLPAKVRLALRTDNQSCQFLRQGEMPNGQDARLGSRKPVRMPKLGHDRNS